MHRFFCIPPSSGEFPLPAATTIQLPPAMGKPLESVRRCSIIFISVVGRRDNRKKRTTIGPSMEPARIKPFRLFRGNSPALAGHLRRIDGK